MIIKIENNGGSNTTLLPTMRGSVLAISVQMMQAIQAMRLPVITSLLLYGPGWTLNNIIEFTCGLG